VVTAIVVPIVATLTAALMVAKVGAHCDPLRRAHMKADHTPVEDVGLIAQEAGGKTLVLSDLTPAFDGINDDAWRSAAAKNFGVQIIVGIELMVV
jgi:ribonuclease BN (tRNA processing enzyme)